MLLFINKHKNFINVFSFSFINYVIQMVPTSWKHMLWSYCKNTEKSECTIEISECQHLRLFNNNSQSSHTKSHQDLLAPNHIRTIQHQITLGLSSTKSHQNPLPPNYTRTFQHQITSRHWLVHLRKSRTSRKYFQKCFEIKPRFPRSRSNYKLMFVIGFK